MYYLKLIQRFWDFNKIVKISPTEIALYFYLLKIGYDNDRYGFTISDMALGKELGLTRVTIKTTREKLKNSGLIQFQTGKGIPCTYRLLLNYSFEIQSEKPQDEEYISTEIMHTSEVLKVAPEIDHQNNENIQIPSLDELIEYAGILPGYESRLDKGISEKYEVWINKGWKNALDRPIRNWKATLKSTLPYLINSTQDHQASVPEIPSIRRPEFKIKKD